MAIRRQERNTIDAEGPATNDPTPEAIKAACERIREAWTPGEAAARARGLTWNNSKFPPSPLLPPTIFLSDLPR
jgi:hypothetical protein